MQFGQKSEGIWNIVLEDGTEVAAVSAAYREYVNKSIEEGDTETITETDIAISVWSEEVAGIDFDTNVPQELVDVLREFHSNTREASQRAGHGCFKVS
jgi:hypothetical protein